MLNIAEIKDFIKSHNGPSGRMYNEKYVRNNFPEINKEIIDYCFENLNDIPFKEKVYHFLYDIKNELKCKRDGCNNAVNFKNSSLGYNEYCSISCISKDSNIKELKERKSYEKFGTKAPAMNIEIKNKIIRTNNEKYGENSPLQNKEIKNKSKKTLMENWGVDNPNKSKDILNKSKRTWMDKYGVDNPKKSKEINEKIENTMLSRYGVKNALQNKEIKEKSKIKQLITLGENIRKIYKDYNIINIDNINKIYTMACEKGHVFEIDYVLLNSRRKTKTLVCTECNPINKSISGLEIELMDFIKNNYENTIMIKDREIINKELDIYLPDLKLAFEFNGLWCHNELNKTENYHFEKTELCEKKDIQLIHIWEDDWIHKNNIIKSMILNKLNKINEKIYARKCQIKEINDTKSIKNFLENNHIQGFTNSKIKLGLFYNDELVSLMTFGKKRIVMNDKNLNENEWEMSRFCNKLYTNVIGGASKLFKYFIENYKPEEIITYANRSYSNGRLYYNLGFEFSNKTNINYYYIVDKIRKHRFTYRKNSLIKNGFDSNKTEHDIMLERKIYRIYDSGNLKFIYKKKEE